MTLRGNGAQHTECLDEIALAELADGRADPADRASRIAHVAGCDRCRQRLSSLVALLSDDGVAAAIAELGPATSTARSRRSWLRAAPLVAAAVIVAIAVPRFVRPTRISAVERDPSSPATALVILAPVGDVTSARELRWAAVSGADLYRVRLYDANTRVVFEAEAQRTSVTLPDSVTIDPGKSYLWRFWARTGIGRWEESSLVEFRVRAPRAP